MKHDKFHEKSLQDCFFLSFIVLYCFKNDQHSICQHESNHCLPLSLYPDSLTKSCLVDLIDPTLVCEDANSKLIEVVTVVDVDAEERVGYSLSQIWKLRFGHKAQLLYRL